MNCLTFCVLLATVCFAFCKPLDERDTIKESPLETWVPHDIKKRFINTALTTGGFDASGLRKLRTKRSEEEECEKLELCRLHARSRQNFFSAFQLYFVNKENAKLWDHQARSVHDCNSKFNCYK